MPGGSRWAADEFPQRPLRLVISVPPGGAADFTGRVVGAKLAEFVGQNVVIEGRPGAGGIVASVYVTSATPDGYTLMLTSSTTHGVAPVLYKKLPYDAMKGFTHISGVSLIPAMMAINADVPAKTVKEFIALTKANPGKYMFSSSGNGSAPQLFGEQFKIMSGAPITHVPYKGQRTGRGGSRGGAGPHDGRRSAVADRPDQGGPPASDRCDGARSALPCSRTCRRWPKPVIRAWKAACGTGCPARPA